MEIYTVIKKGKAIRQFLDIPDDFIDVDLEITIKPVRPKEIFRAKL